MWGISLVAALLAASAAQAVPVTFQVRMGYQVELGNFDPALDSVVVAGSFNGWGTAPLTPLADANGDTIYEITLEGFSASETIEFKFRINGLWDGSEEFPGGGPNRVYTVQTGGNEILVWYGDVVYQAPDVGQLSWWNDAVFYEILVRSFHDSDGDGIGDLPGLTQQLDYLNDGDPATTDDLGITAIWLMPINDSPSYHGYDAVDYRAINPDYGTMADFEAFLAAAHARGIKVIVDYVMNHCSTQHPWFQAAAAGNPIYRDYFRWSASDPGQTGPWGQQVWHWDPSGYYYGLFWGGMPDLNYENPAVKTEMFDTATYWLDTVGVDGFRLDAVLYILEDGSQLENTAATLQFWQDYNQHVKAVNPDVVSVGEAWSDPSTVLDYVVDDRLDFCFEFSLASSILGAAGGADAQGLANTAQQVYGLYPYLQWGTFLTNHDQNRAFTVLGEDQGKAEVAAGIYLSLPGVPFLYYGEEIGMVGSKPDEYIRTPMQWTDGPDAGFTTGTPWMTINANYPQYNVAVEQQDPTSLLAWYKELIAVRNGTPALRRGEYLPLASSAGSVLAFQRQHEQQTVLCLANTANFALSGVTVTGSAAGLTPGDHALVNLLDATDTPTVTVTAAYEINGLDLAAHEVAIYEFVNTSGVEPGDGGPPRAGLQLQQNHPNPFNPSTTIRYVLPEHAHVKLSVYDVAGRELAVIRDGAQEAGSHVESWDGRDRTGRPLGTGVYFVRLVAAGETRVSKMLLMK